MSTDAQRVVVRKAAKLIGGVAKLAEGVGVTPAAVSQWISGHRPVPAERVLRICRATGGEVTPHELRPDLYPHPDDGMRGEAGSR